MTCITTCVRARARARARVCVCVKILSFANEECAPISMRTLEGLNKCNTSLGNQTEHCVDRLISSSPLCSSWAGNLPLM
jgi:hypothetical protein